MKWMTVIKSGLFSTIQDMGRVGYRSKGIPLSGALDRSSAVLANWLVGNPPRAAVIEMTAEGLHGKMLASCAIAVTGGVAEMYRNDESLSENRTHYFNEGDVLRISRISSGYRAYLAVGGTLEADMVLGSASTYAPCGFGGFHGRSLRKGDELHFFYPHSPAYSQKALDSYEHTFTQELIRFVPGPEWGMLLDREMEYLLDTTFSVLPESDRMGIRLTAKNPYENNYQIISVPVLPGTMQLLPDGRPVVLMADGQTTGGYPRIGQVIRQDMDILAQKRPHEKIRFKLISMEEALYLYHYRNKKLNALFRK